MVKGLMKPIEYEKIWKVRGNAEDIQRVLSPWVKTNKYKILAQDASQAGSPRPSPNLHQKIRVGMTYGAKGGGISLSLGSTIGFGRTKVHGPKLGETNRLHIWYYLEGTDTTLYVRGMGMKSKMDKAIESLEETLRSRMLKLSKEDLQKFGR